MEGDWELIHDSDTESTDSNTISGVIDDGMILSDHFSSDYLPTDQSQYGLVDYGSVDQSVDPEIGEVRLSDCDFEAAESEAVAEDASKCDVADDERQVESQSGVEEPIEDSSISWCDSEQIVSDSGAVEGSAESKGREAVWWKLPFALVKYCAFKIGPVWSVSMAAAAMGFLLLGRRLYYMKKKAQSFHLKVAIDDEKASRVMSQAAQLNQVFREVRRVPVIRPALPSPGAWPVLSLR